MAIHTGECVVLRSPENPAAVMPAKVILASPNGRSLMVEFDGVIAVDRGLFCGAVPLFQDDDGVYHDLFGQATFLVERAN